MFGLIREKQKPVLIDADGLYIVTKNLDLIKGYPLAILTPNRNEYQRLAAALDVDTGQVHLHCPPMLGVLIYLPLSKSAWHKTAAEEFVAYSV